jgi:hypothetical protein
MGMHFLLRRFTMTTVYPLQVSVHDWTKPGTPVWTRTQGYLCPELETPASGQVILFVDYRKDLKETLIQAHVELAIDALGYPAGSRWIGRSPLDTDTVVSLVGIFPAAELAQHIERVREVVSEEFLSIFDGSEYGAIAA